MSLNPHFNDEARLMLKGEKPVAMLSWHDGIIKLFRLKRAATKGQILYQPITNDRGLTTHFFCLPGKEDDMDELIEIYRDREIEGLQAEFTAADHRRIGELLGYPEEAIERYINHRFPSLEA